MLSVEKDVPWLFHVCFICVSGVLQVCFRCGSQFCFCVLQRVFKAGSRVFQGCCMGIDRRFQGGRITGNLGTRFPRNLEVSHEILIINPAHLSRKCDTPKRRPKIHKESILSHKKIYFL